MDRLVLTPKAEAYFKTQPVETFSSGCALLDCVLGGGYALGRVVNVVGDKSTGKTLLAIEATANFAMRYPHGHIWYNEVESAFDSTYAESMGLPLARTELVLGCTTIEDVFEDLQKRLEGLNKNSRGLYIIDSLDALSDRQEQEKAIGEGTWGLGKAKMMSRMFRQLIQKLSETSVSVMIISQVRDNIGVMFGEKHTRSGGRALDFYASQIIWLAHLKTLVRTVHKVKRPVGIQIRVKCKKNKVGAPFRDCEVPIMFFYGMDDVNAHLTWLEEVDKLNCPWGNTAKQAWQVLTDLPDAEFALARKQLAGDVLVAWAEIEESFAPERIKYETRSRQAEGQCIRAGDLQAPVAVD